MYKINDVITGEVFFISDTHFIVNLDLGWTGLVHISEVSDYYVSDIKYFIAINDKVSLKVIGIDQEKKQLKLSYKRLMPRLMKDPFKYTIKETKEGFKELKNHTDEKIKSKEYLDD